jgi:predicted metalloprotease
MACTTDYRSIMPMRVAVCSLLGTVVVSAMLASCAVEGGEITAVDGTRRTRPSSTTVSDSPETTTAPVTTTDIDVLTADLQDFWADELPKLYRVEYTALPQSRIVAMTSDSADSPRCDGARATFDDVKGNAFAAPCDEGPLVVYDAESLFPDLIERFGIVGPAVVLAHEWGHIAQIQADVQFRLGVLAEQQADCFAGAWLAQAGDRVGGALADPQSLDAQIGALLEFRDQPGFSAQEDQAHGSGFDRVRAVQEGYEGGMSLCADYPSNPPTLTEVPFSTEAELATGGNVSFEEILTLATTDLNVVYARRSATFPAIASLLPIGTGGASTQLCNGERIGVDEIIVRYCAPESAVAYDVRVLQQLHNGIGDTATATVLGLAWAEAARQSEGLSPDVGGNPAVLYTQACLTGGWFRSVIDNADETRKISLSPGDLDEAIEVFVQFGQNAGLGRSGQVFATVGALRQGVMQGGDSCKVV